MKKRVLEAERTLEGYTRLSWEDESGRRGADEYLFTAGSVAWPHEMLPGIILMAGKEQKSERVLVFVEREFRSFSEAVEIFDSFWNQYLPAYYYCLADSDREIKKSRGFIMHLRMDERMREKLPFAFAPNADNIDYGHQLIKDYLNKTQLMVPAAGILAAQLQGNFTSTDDSLYAVEALRYLLAGILVCPFKVEKKEIRRAPRDGSEVAWLELAAIRERLEETDGW